MIWDIKEFDKEVELLKRLKQEGPILHPLVKEQIKQRLLREMKTGADANSNDSVFEYQTKKRLLVRYATVSLIGFSLVAGTALASQNSLPGNFLYPVKTGVEEIQLGLTIGATARAEVSAKQAQTRLDEYSKLQAQQTNQTETGTPNSQDGSPNGNSSNQGQDQGINKPQTPITSGTVTREAAAETAETKQQSKNKNIAANGFKNSLAALQNIKQSLETKGDNQALQQTENDITQLTNNAINLGIDVQAVKGRSIKSDNSGNKDNNQDNQGKGVKNSRSNSGHSSINP